MDESQQTSWNVDSKYEAFSLFGCRARAVTRNISVRIKNPKIKIIFDSLAARRCPANICIAQRIKPFKTKINRFFFFAKIYSFILNKAIRYFVILADDTVGCEYVGRNNSLNIEPLSEIFERNNGSSIGW